MQSSFSWKTFHSKCVQNLYWSSTTLTHRFKGGSPSRLEDMEISPTPLYRLAIDYLQLGLDKSVKELYADASGNSSLGWGAFLPARGLWMFQQWDKESFQQFNPSIDFLELCALLARGVTWIPHLSDKTVIFRSDNTPTMHALINKSSNSKQMLILLQYFTLFCMIHNIHIKAMHISGKKNVI